MSRAQEPPFEVEVEQGEIHVERVTVLVETDECRLYDIETRAKHPEVLGSRVYAPEGEWKEFMLVKGEGTLYAEDGTDAPTIVRLGLTGDWWEAIGHDKYGFHVFAIRVEKDGERFGTMRGLWSDD